MIGLILAMLSSVHAASIPHFMDIRDVMLALCDASCAPQLLNIDMTTECRGLQPYIYCQDTPPYEVVAINVNSETGVTGTLSTVIGRLSDLNFIRLDYSTILPPFRVFFVRFCSSHRSNQWHITGDKKICRQLFFDWVLMPWFVSPKWGSFQR